MYFCTLHWMKTSFMLGNILSFFIVSIWIITFYTRKSKHWYACSEMPDKILNMVYFENLCELFELLKSFLIFAKKWKYTMDIDFNEQPKIFIALFAFTQNQTDISRFENWTIYFLLVCTLSSILIFLYSSIFSLTSDYGL